MWVRCTGVVVAAAVVVASAVVAAQPANGGLAVSLTVDACVDVDPREVRRLFSLELGTSVPDAVQSDTPEATLVEVLCDGALVELRVHDPVTGKSLTRRIELAGKGRERLLALAVMELLVASWVELEATPKPAVPGADTRAAPATRRHARAIVSKRLPSRSREGGWRATTSLLGGVAIASPSLHGGGGIRVTFDGPSGFGWGADVLVHRATDELDLGAVRVSSVEGGLSVHAHWRWRTLTARFAAGARVGAVTLTGEATMDNVVGNSVTGLAGGPFARLTAGAELARHLVVELSVEPGYHLFPVRGFVDGSERTSVEGARLGSHLAVGWTW